MGLIDRISTAVSNKIGDALFTYLQSFGGSGVNYKLGIRRLDNTSDFQKAFKGFVDTALTKISDAIADTQFVAYHKNIVTGEEVAVGGKHWMQALLDDPNPLIHRNEFFKLLTKWFYINGNGYAQASVSRFSNKPVSFWILPSSLTGVKVNAGGSSLIDGYTFGQYNAAITIPTHEVLHLRNLEPSTDPRDVLLGKSIVFKAIDDINIEYETKQHLKRWFENDTNPPMVWETENRVPQEQWNILKERWDANNPNLRLRGLLEDGAKVANVATGGMEISLDVLDTKTVRSIGATLGISADYILYGSQATRASMETMQVEFMQGAIEPKRKYIAEALTKFAQYYEPNLVIRHVPFLYKDANEARLQDEFDLSLGIKTIDDLRSERGVEPLPDGKGSAVLIKSGFVTLDSILSPQQPATPAVGVKKKDFGIAEEDVVTYWKRYDDIANKYADKLQTQIAGVYERLGEEVRKSGKVKAYQQTKADGDLFDVEFWKKELVRRTGKELNQYIVTIIENALKDVSLNYDDLSNEFDRVLQLQLKLSTEKITTSVDTVKDELETFLKDNTNLSTEELTAGIQQKFTFYTEGGAKRIAQTTSNFAKGAAKKEAWEDVGFKRKWLSQRDGKVRPAHAAADGQLEKNGMFTVGGEVMAHPCGGGIAGNNINCRCDTFPVKNK